ncbi:AT-hook motif nuclear-localized protein 11-like [Typha latifolia]|uniref:AT-hook motif nuclear-localized protein 11-like n=1 Tax=Typha latifolia TaxID=4733 RepID=UPI003C2F2E13
MDGREGIVTSGSDLSSYYIQHRGAGGSVAGLQAGIHGVHSGIHHVPNPSSSFTIQTPHFGGGSIGSVFQMESQHNINAGGLVGINQEEPVKRKRGRPRKYRPDGTMLSPLSLTPPVSGSGLVSGAASLSPSHKRGRGRPPGTGRKQQLASLGEWVAGSAGMGFTPHIITVPPREDIAARIMSFSQQGPRAVCILSAYGAVSTVALHQSSTSGGIVTYEGHFEILCLSGSYLLTDSGSSRTRSGGLSISLSGSDGRVIGGGVGGVLIAASTVQVIVGSFIYGGTKMKNKHKNGEESGVHSDLFRKQDTQINPAPDQDLAPSSVSGGWPGSTQIDSRSSNIDINLTRG